MLKSLNIPLTHSDLAYSILDCLGPMLTTKQCMSDLENCIFYFDEVIMLMILCKLIKKCDQKFENLLWYTYGYAKNKYHNLD